MKSDKLYNEIIVHMFKCGRFSDMLNFYTSYQFAASERVVKLAEAVSEFCELINWVESLEYRSKAENFNEVDKLYENSFYLYRDGEYIYVRTPFCVDLPIGIIKISKRNKEYFYQISPTPNWADIADEYIS